MIKGKINPLNVLGIRELEFPPAHFHYLILDLRSHQAKKIREWIYDNLKHRFYLGETVTLDNNQLTFKVKIGFEDAKESSLFLLSCSLLTEK
jgi:hypothetical protein